MLKGGRVGRAPLAVDDGADDAGGGADDDGGGAPPCRYPCVDDKGGAVLVEGGTLVMYDCTLEHNTAASGGAVFAADARVWAYRVVFSENYAAELGGAIDAEVL